MDQIAMMQSPAAMALMQSGALGGMGGLFGTQTGLSGGFLDLMMQLMGQTGGEDAALLGMGQQEPGKKTNQDDLWMQMLAGLMAADGMNQDFAIQMLLQQPTEQAAQLVQAMTGTDARSARAVVEALAGTQTEAEPEEDSGKDVRMEILETPGQQKEQAGQKQTDALFWGGRFRSAVDEAQRLIGRDNGRKDDGKLNVEAAQNDVDTGKYVPTAAYTDKELPLPDAKDVAEQARAGIVRNLSSLRGKNEFVVRLKPEGLGEIVVHLSQEAGRTTLSLVASNEQTARMLNSELAGLRESLKPYNADVREVVSQQPDQRADMQSAYNQQEQARQQQEQAQQHRAPADDFGDFLFGANEQAEEEPAAAGIYI